jgi:hypothetical protein
MSGISSEFPTGTNQQHDTGDDDEDIFSNLLGTEKQKEYRKSSKDIEIEKEMERENKLLEAELQG